MKIKFYVINHDGYTYTCYITNKSDGNNFKSSHKLKKDLISKNFTISPYFFHLFINEINNCPNYRHSLSRFIHSSSSPYIIQIVPASLEFIDKVW